MSHRTWSLLLAALAFTPAARGADGPKPDAPKPDAPKAEAAADAKPDSSLLSEEEKWVFEPNAGRVDPFYDLRKKLKLELDFTPDAGVDTALSPWVKGNPSDWAKAQIQKVEQAMVTKKWDEAMRTCDTAIKQLSKDPDNDEAQALIEKFKRYRTQAEEAKTYEEAQAKFDALDLRIEGILWSPTGSLAVINGEPRARGVNERVKDCVIINIDTNRVDFLFHHNRRRFEFQRYVGEDAKASARKNQR